MRPGSRPWRLEVLGHRKRGPASGEASQEVRACFPAGAAWCGRREGRGRVSGTGEDSLATLPWPRSWPAQSREGTVHKARRPALHGARLPVGAPRPGAGLLLLAEGGRRALGSREVALVPFNYGLPRTAGWGRERAESASPSRPQSCSGGR